MPPPRTKAIIRIVSECAKALARRRSGIRSWMLASMASFEMPLKMAVTKANSASIPRL